MSEAEKGRQVDPRIADPQALGPAALPRSNGELVFEAPWESRAFGVALALTAERGSDWEEFRGMLIDEIGAWEREHGIAGDESWSYYERWLASLERLALQRGLVTAEEIETRMREAEDEAAHEHDHEHEHHHHGEET